MKEVSHLEVGELRVLLLQDVGHVVNQVQTKGVLGGDFLPNAGRSVIHVNTHTHTPTLVMLLGSTLTFSVESLMQVE